MAQRTPKTTPKSSGRFTVNYRHTDGQMMDAVVEGGTGTALNLWVPHLPKGSQHKVAVARRTTIKQTNVWGART